MGTLYVKQGGSMVEQGGGGSSGGSTGTGNSRSVGPSVSSPFINVAAGGTSHTKTATPVQLIASTAHAADTLIVTVGDVFGANNDTSALLDIMTGASSSETVLIGNIPVGFWTAGTSVVFRVAIASGTRISARAQCQIASRNIPVTVHVAESGDSLVAATAIDTMGANTGTSNGLALTNPASNNVEASWTDIDTNTANAYTRLTVAATATSTAGVSAASGQIDIGLWNGSSYDVIIENLGYVASNTEAFYPYGIGVHPYVRSIPAGSRLGARYQASTNAAAGGPTIVLFGHRS